MGAAPHQVHYSLVSRHFVLVVDGRVAFGHNVHEATWLGLW